MSLPIRSAGENQTCSTICVFVLSLILAPAVFAQNNTWTNTGDGFWQDATNWSQGSPSSTQLGIFITNANTKTVTIDDTTTNFPGTLTISNLTVSAPSASINTLELVNAGNDVPLHVIRGLAISDGGALLIDNSSLIMDGAAGGSFTNNGSVTVQNGGLLVLTNSRIGSLVGNTGTLTVTSSTFTNFGALVVGSAVGTRGEMVLSNSSALFSGGTVTVGTVPGVGGGYGSLTIHGGTSIFSSAGLTVGVNSATRFPTGTVLITGGALVSMTNNANSSIAISSHGLSEMTVTNAKLISFIITVGNSAGSKGALTVESGGELHLPVPNGLIRIGDNTGSTGLVTLAGGTMTIRDGVEMGRSGFGQLIISNGTFSQTAPSGSGVGTFVGFQAAGGYGIFRMFGGTTTLSAPVLIGSAVGSTGIVEMAGGNLTVSRSISVGIGGYGEMTISGGTSTLSSVGGTFLSVGSATGAVGILTISGGQVSVLSHALIGLSGTGTMNVAGGTVMISSNLFLGTNTAANGTLAISGGAMFVTNAGNSAALDLRRGSLQLDGGSLTVSRLIVTNGGTGLVTFNDGTLNVKTSVIANTQAFVVGDGLAAATLNLLGGSHSFANGLSISSNAMLKGTGTVVDSTTTIDDGGILSPGSSPGTLTVSNLSLNGGSFLDFELGPHDTSGIGYAGLGSNDLVGVTGNLFLDGILNVTALTDFNTFGVGPAATNVYRLFNYSGTLTDAGLSIGLLPSYAQGFIDLTTTGQVNLLVTEAVVPEPSALTLLGLSSLFLLLRRRRHQK